MDIILTRWEMWFILTIGQGNRREDRLCLEDIELKGENNRGYERLGRSLNMTRNN